MQKDIMEREIAEIIKGFRQDSIEIEMNQEHVHKWISQFSPDTQNIILEETLHILKEWYFPKDKINLFLDKMMDYLKSENENATDEEPMKDIYFWNIQESGKSQSQLVEMLNDRVNQKYGCGIRTGKLISEKYYVYLDDGLYTGSRLRKDIKRCIEMIPEGSRIDVIYMIACQSGLDFSKRILEELCKTKNIKINILRDGTLDIGNSFWAAADQIKFKGSEQYLLLPENENDLKIIDIMSDMTDSFESSGYHFKTGPVVEFRNLEHIHAQTHI